MGSREWSRMMDTAKMNQAIRIAKLYYELHYNQLEIAAREQGTGDPGAQPQQAPHPPVIYPSVQAHGAASPLPL